jgi:hydroxypyruvate reductase
LAERGIVVEGSEAPKPGEFACDVRLIAAPRLALGAAADAARHEGLTPLVIGDALEGESRELGTITAGIARSVRQGNRVKDFMVR